jgi:predicted nucleic acid-binding protein
MRTLHIRHVPDEVAARLEKLAARAGLPFSTFALQELTEASRRADIAERLSVLRRLVLAGTLQEGHALQALATANRLGLCRHPSRALWPPAWEPRANLSPYDALYVALAEHLGAPLLTADTHLARAPGLRCVVEVA